jgi:hypothetical protein
VPSHILTASVAKVISLIDAVRSGEWLPKVALTS